jgi:hypothetical protein
MTKHKTKEALLSDIQTQRRQLEKNLHALTPAEKVAPGVVGEWSVKDLLAHLVAWEQLLLSWDAAGRASRIPAITPVGLSRAAIAVLNQQIYAQNYARTLEAVQEEFHSSYEQVWAVLQTIPEEEMFTAGRFAWTGQLTLADYIAGNTCSHYRWAKNQIRRRFAVKRS